MLIYRRFFYPHPAVSAIRWRGEDSRSKIAAKAKMWFGGDVAEAECKIRVALTDMLLLHMLILREFLMKKRTGT